METTLISADEAEQPGLAAAFAAWSRLPSLSAALTAPDSVHLVIDPGTGRVLHASPTARPLSDVFAAADLSRQIAAAAPRDAAPLLARLRFDPRRIAPPVLCWLARSSQEGGKPAILVLPTAPVTPPRTKARPPEPAGTMLPEPAQPVPPPKREDRFLWRLDAAGTLVSLTGSDVLAGLVGQRWQDLAAAGRVAGAEGMLAALRDRRTFRGEPASLDAGTGPFQVELSGAPLGRDEAAFAGFAGFGLIRGLPSARSDAPADAAAATAMPTPAASPEPGSARGAASEPEPTAAPLSTDEHAAFREIARALGARYAGDEAAPEDRRPKAEGGAVMVFPGPQPGPAEPRDDRAAAGAFADILAGLPLPALVHRGGTILAANGRLLSLTGHTDVVALSASGLSGLFPGASQEAETDPPTRLTAIAAADGRARPVEALSGPCTWAGEAALCLVLRPVDEADAAAALAAERLARTAQTERAASAEATLNALETGTVTLDQAGRILAVNRAAAGLLGCEPQEIVGASFVAQVDRDSVLAVADLLRGVARGRRIVLLAGQPVTLDVRAVEGDGRRVAVIERTNHPPAAATDLAGDRAPSNGAGTALARLDRAFREPLAGMIDLADAMLTEPFGTLGDARYRACLTEIKASADAMLERVGKLLDLAAVEAGTLHLEPRALDLNDLAAGCVAQLQAAAARGRIVVRTSFSTDLGELEADERSVTRAAALVIENAIRRSTAGGQIIVSTGAAERTAVALRVRDTGAATRAAGPAGDVEEGLALPRALVEANGGRLQLSTPNEDGTLVEIIMPTRRAANG